ncbi:MAG: carboxypeptidase-like regulatory domain-containing protein [Hyphomicrobiales bacterium]
MSGGPRIAMAWPGALRAAAAAVVAAALLGAVPGGASAATISGRVLKGPNDTPAPGVPVSIHLIRGDRELPGKTVSSGKDGSFSFPNLTEGSDIEYYLSTEYEGAFYTEGPLDVSGPTKSATQNLTIYDVGKDFDAVHVSNEHIIVEKKDDGLHVTEILVFQNGANTAYLGVGINHAEASGARVGLPAAIKDFEPGMGADDQTVHVQGRELTSLRPIPPGQRPFSFSYVVPNSARMDLSHRVYFPTHSFEVMLDDPKLHLESPQLTNAGSREQGGRTFTLYTASDLPVGSEVSIRVNGAGFFSNPAIYPWLAAPILIVIVIFVASRLGRRRLEEKRALAGAAFAPDATAPGFAGPETEAPGPGSPAGPGAPGRPAPARIAPTPVAAAAPGGKGPDDDLAETYVYLIAALDQGVERGEISKESHALVRGNLKRRLETILSHEPRTGTR